MAGESDLDANGTTPDDDELVQESRKITKSGEEIGPSPEAIDKNGCGGNIGNECNEKEEAEERINDKNVEEDDLSTHAKIDNSLVIENFQVNKAGESSYNSNVRNGVVDTEVIVSRKEFKDVDESEEKSGDIQSSKQKPYNHANVTEEEPGNNANNSEMKSDYVGDAEQKSDSRSLASEQKSDKANDDELKSGKTVSEDELKSGVSDILPKSDSDSKPRFADGLNDTEHELDDNSDAAEQNPDNNLEQSAQESDDKLDVIPQMSDNKLTSEKMEQRTLSEKKIDSECSEPENEIDHRDAIEGESDGHEESEKLVNGDDQSEVMDTVFEEKYTGKTCQLPNFAVVYSFLNLFGAMINLPSIPLTDLEQSIDSTKDLGTDKDAPGIVDMLLMKLFRKLNKSRFSSLSNCQMDRLNKCVLKFCQMTEMDFAWDLERFGFHILTSDQKLSILKMLCEIQFDENVKFRNDLQEMYKSDQTVLRLSPYGYEQEGLSVWLHEDSEYNVHVYAGEKDDADSWKVRVGCLEDMPGYISKLKLQTEVNPKDLAVEKIKERRIQRQIERDERRLERERRRQEEEEKRAKKKGRSKRRGRRRKGDEEEEEPVPVIIESSESSCGEDDGCCRCYENKAADIVLLCDGCDAAYHTLCLRPPVIDIPDEDWYCPFCLQVKLVEQLEGKFSELKKKVSTKERKARRLDFYGIRMDNIMDQEGDGRRGRAAARRVDYNFSDYDNLIKEAVSAQGQKVPLYQDYKLSGDESNTIVDDRPKPRRSAAFGMHKRKLNAMSSDEDDPKQSDGSEYIQSSGDDEFKKLSRKSMKSSMKNFINDDLDEIENRYEVRKRRAKTRNGRRAQRRAGTRASTRTKKRRRYNDDTSDSDASDVSFKSEKSSDTERPQGRKLRERKPSNFYTYTQLSGDEEDDYFGEIDKKPEKEDDGGDWADENEEAVIEEFESDEYKSDDGDDVEEEEKVPEPTRQSSRVTKKKRYVISDEESDQEVPYDDHESPKEERSEKKRKNHVLDDDEEEEDEEEEDDDEDIEEEEEREVEEGHCSEKDSMNDGNTLDAASPKEKESVKETNELMGEYDSDTEREGRCRISSMSEELSRKTVEAEGSEQEILRKMMGDSEQNILEKGEETLANKILHDDGVNDDHEEDIMKSMALDASETGFLPPCFSSSLPDKEDTTEKGSKDEMNLFRSSVGENVDFQNDDFLKNLCKEDEDEKKIKLKEDEDKTSVTSQNSHQMSTVNIKSENDEDSPTDIPSNNEPADIKPILGAPLMRNALSNGHDAKETTEGAREPNSTASALVSPQNNHPTQQLANPLSLTGMQPAMVRPGFQQSRTGFSPHASQPRFNDMLTQRGPLKPQSFYHHRTPLGPTSPTSNYNRPPPPYRPTNATQTQRPSIPDPRSPLRPPLPSRGPMHPQHRLRALLAANAQRAPQFNPHSPQPGLPFGPGAGQIGTTASSIASQQTLLHEARLRQSVQHRQRHPISPQHQVPSPPHTAGPLHEQLRLPQSPVIPQASQQQPQSPSSKSQLTELQPHVPQPRASINPPSSSPISLPTQRQPTPYSSPNATGRPAINPVARPIHPAARLPSHPSSRLRGPTTAGSAAPSTAMNLPRPLTTEPVSQTLGVRGPHPPYHSMNAWPGNRPPGHEFYPQMHRLPTATGSGVGPSQFYGRTPMWPDHIPPEWVRAQQMAAAGMQGHPSEGVRKPTPKKKEKQAKKNTPSAASYPSSPPSPSNNPVGNMNFFKNMVIGGNNSGNGTGGNEGGARI